MRIQTPRHCLLAAVLLGVACTAQLEEPDDGGGSPFAGAGGSAGATLVGGAGGASGPRTGGQPGISTGGRAPDPGGGTGGQGKGATGGVPGNMTGGTANGGNQATGGAGKGSSTGGASTGGRGSGFPGTGGKASGGASTGGRASGGSSTGGTASGMGGSGGVPASGCTEANRALSSNATGKHCGYTYEYWKDSGTGTLNLTPDGFNVEWSNINNLLGRKGIRPGSDALVVTYESDYQPNGNSYLTVYGWTTNPLVEYYIVDSWGNWRPPGGEGRVGATVSSDGGSYDLYKLPRSGAHIQGNGAFTQYWSVRTEKKTAGAITVGNHFNAWRNNGMPMGSLYEVSLSVEGYQSAGRASVKFSIR